MNVCKMTRKRALLAAALCSVASAAIAQQAQVLVPSGPPFPGVVGNNSISIGPGAAITAPNDTAVGVGALPFDTGTGGNTAFGYNAMNAPIITNNSTAFGYQALLNTSGHAVNGFGANAAGTVTTGYDNVAVGNDAMNNDDVSAFTTGFDNTAVGIHTLGHLSTGSFNVAIGSEALVGCGNWTGFPAGACLLTGNGNVAVGNYALQTAQGAAAQNVAVGYNTLSALTTGSSNVVLGSTSGTNITTATNDIIIGYNIPADSATLTFRMNIGQTIKGDTYRGHLMYGPGIGGLRPTVSACGTTPSVDANATDISGTITAGSGTVTSCTLTFGSAYPNYVHCRVTTQSAVASLAYTPSTSALVITGTSLTSVKIDYDCDGGA